MASGNTLAALYPLAYEPTASNYATISLRNQHPTLQFDDTTAWTAIWTVRMPRHYAGGGITVYITWTAIATSGNVGWTVEIERMDAATDLDSDSFAAAATVTAATVDATSGKPKETNVAITAGANMDSTVAGDFFRIRIKRDVATDTAVGNAEIMGVEIKET